MNKDKRRQQKIKELKEDIRWYERSYHRDRYKDERRQAKGELQELKRK